MSPVPANTLAEVCQSSSTPMSLRTQITLNPFDAHEQRDLLALIDPPNAQFNASVREHWTKVGDR